MPRTPRKPARRTRAVRDDIRERLLEAALAEFGAKGFDGASTRAIAQRIGAHQPQIHYHFESKEALWRAAVDHLFASLAADLADLAPSLGSGDVATATEATAEAIRRFVQFAARHPELNRIMVHEATLPSDRLSWMTEQHVRPLYDTLRPVWRRLRRAGVAAPIDDRLLHYVLVGAASLLYVNAPEARILAGIEPTDPRWVKAHADGLVAMLLPSREAAPRAKSPARRKA